MVKSERIELPEEVLAACAETKAEWRKSLSSHSLSRVTEGPTIAHAHAPICASIRMVRSKNSPLADPSFIITFEIRRSGCRHLEVSRKAVLAALAVLTPCEREIAILCAEGKTNAEIATAHRRSIGTIKAELHSIFKKLGVRTRTELAIVLLGGR